MSRREREILEHTVRTVSEQAVKADELVDEAKAAGGGDHPVTVHAKMLRLELLKVKADLERELRDVVAELHAVRPRRALGVWARRDTGALGAPGARAARRSRRLVAAVERHHYGLWVGRLQVHVSVEDVPLLIAELLIDCEEDRILRAALVGMLQRRPRSVGPG